MCLLLFYKINLVKRFYLYTFDFSKHQNMAIINFKGSAILKEALRLVAANSPEKNSSQYMLKKLNGDPLIKAKVKELNKIKF